MFRSLVSWYKHSNFIYCLQYVFLVFKKVFVAEDNKSIFNTFI